MNAQALKFNPILNSCLGQQRPANASCCIFLIFEVFGSGNESSGWGTGSFGKVMKWKERWRYEFEGLICRLERQSFVALLLE